MNPKQDLHKVHEGQLVLNNDNDQITVDGVKSHTMRKLRVFELPLQSIRSKLKIILVILQLLFLIIVMVINFLLYVVVCSYKT